jgi:predicted kinase
MIAPERPVPVVRGEPAIVARVRLRAARRVQWLRHLWSHGPVDGGQWLATSHEEIDRILEGPAVLGGREGAFYRSDPTCAALGPAIARADQAASGDPRWRRLVDEFGLEPVEADLLTLAVAASIDPSLRRVFGYVEDATAPRDATAQLAGTLFEWAPGSGIRSGTPLLGWRLAVPVDPGVIPSLATTEWIADPDVVHWLLTGEDGSLDRDRAVRRLAATGHEPLDAGLTADVRAFASTGRSPGVVVPLSRARRARDRRERADPPSRIVEIGLVGSAGSGKKTLAADVCASLGGDVISVDVARLGGGPAEPEFSNAVIRVARMARLARLAIYWHGLEGLGAGGGSALRGLVPLAFFASSGPIQRDPDPSISSRTFAIPDLSRSARARLWSRLSQLPLPDPVRDWTLTPAAIAAAAEAAPRGPEAVLDACRRLVRLDPSEVVSTLATPYDWDDIVLADPIREHLAEFEAQARNRGVVYDDWGFDRLVPLGRGITALFAGPSGTGKTMAAQVLARSLGMPLFRVDLSGVMNKYIGETEKRLKLVFDLCERVNVVLLFDEADALFGQRSQVRDAHDRFANIEIDYLLQRMEQFDGIAVLATNRKADMDQAFLRRLRFSIDFIPPGPRERLELWQRSLPARSPIGDPLLDDDIDWELLSQRLDLSGAAIKAAAIGAAFLAQSQSTRIGMAHILHAASREMTKYAIEAHLGAWEN